MCTSIVEIVSASGAGKSSGGWFDLTQAAVSYDHPHHALPEEAITIETGSTDRLANMNAFAAAALELLLRQLSR